MDSQGILVKKLLTINQSILLNNFVLKDTSLSLINSKKILNFETKKYPSKVIFSQGWMIKTDSLSKLKFSYMNNFFDLESDMFLSDINHLNQIFNFKTNLKKFEDKLELDNLGLVLDMTLYNQDRLTILCRTERSTKVLVVSISQINAFIANSGQSNKDYFENEDSEQDSNDGSEIATADLNFYKIITSFKDKIFNDAVKVFCLDEAFLVDFGISIKLFSLQMKEVRCWEFDGYVSAIKEIATLPGKEVRFNIYMTNNNLYN